MNFPYLHNLVVYLHAHPHIGLILALLIAFAESLAIVGAVVPGSVTMTAIGALIGSGVMPFTPTLIAAIVGAFLGDWLSFWIGKRYHQKLKIIWPFRNNLRWLARGEDFFQRHGGKSVVFGRFFGPARSAIPLIAGLMQMSNPRFILAALPSATIWAMIYMAPGILIGELSLELPPHLATLFIVSVLGVVAFGWIFFLLFHLFCKKILKTLDHWTEKSWNWLKIHPKTAWLTNPLSYPNMPQAHRQLALLLCALMFGLCFLWITADVVLQRGLAQFNEPVFILLRSFRNHGVESFMLIGSILGDKMALIPAATLIAMGLMAKRYYWTALHWTAAILTTTGSVQLIKYLYYSPRPPGLLHGPISSSFPSGHTMTSVGFYGFLALMVAQILPQNKRSLPYWIGLTLVLWVGISRLYLGAHWLTDVVAGFSLALFWLLLVMVSYRSRLNLNPLNKKFAYFAMAITLSLTGGYGWIKFRSLQYDYTLTWSNISLSTQTWWNHKDNQMKASSHEIPLLLVSRLGKPSTILNLQWLGDLKNIQVWLQKQGWEIHSSGSSWKDDIERLSFQSSLYHFSWMPDLYQNQAPVLFMTKTIPNQPPLQLILWKSNVTFKDAPNQTLWIGNLSTVIHRTHQTFQSLQKNLSNSTNEMMTEFSTQLTSAPWKIITILPQDQPAAISDFHWDGQLLLIMGTPKP